MIYEVLQTLLFFDESINHFVRLIEVGLTVEQIIAAMVVVVGHPSNYTEESKKIFPLLIMADCGNKKDAARKYGAMTILLPLARS